MLWSSIFSILYVSQSAPSFENKISKKQRVLRKNKVKKMLKFTGTFWTKILSAGRVRGLNLLDENHNCQFSSTFLRFRSNSKEHLNDYLIMFEILAHIFDISSKVRHHNVRDFDPNFRHFDHNSRHFEQNAQKFAAKFWKL